MSVSLRVAIPKSELDRLLKIVDFHEKNCKSENENENASGMSGSGAEG